MNFLSQLLSQRAREVFKKQKFEHLHLHDNWESFEDEDHVRQSKAPEGQIKGPSDEIVL